MELILKLAALMAWVCFVAQSPAYGATPHPGVSLPTFPVKSGVNH